jgi:hypothetical protein
MMFKPGMVGTVKAILPKVRLVRGKGYDSKADFLVVEYHEPATGKNATVGLNFVNVLPLTDSRKPRRSRK